MDFKKIGALIGFVVLASISCWATYHSFHLLLDKTLPSIFIWALTIALFIVASYGTKMIFDALNYDIYVEHRRGVFWGGFVLVLFFWFFMSLPTNTHTFFYNHSIGNTVQNELATTDSYLLQISNRINTDTANYNPFYKRVRELFDSVSLEYHGRGPSGRLGNGPFVKEGITRINGLLEEKLPGSQINFIDQSYGKFVPAIITGYENQVTISLAKIKDKVYKVSPKAADEAREISKKIEIMSDTIQTMVQLGEIHEDVIKQTTGVIESGYSCVKNNSKYINFNGNETEEKEYTAVNIETRTKRMLSVIDVWVDFFCGKYPMSFIWYILLSILVDVGAFLFFDFAFKKDE